MKLALTTFLFLVFMIPSFANEIDELKTLEDVNQFLKAKVLPKDFGTIILDPSKANTSKDYGKHKFYKLDLNGDSLTDLLADGNYFIAVVDAGNGKYDLAGLDRGTFSLIKYTLKNVEWILKSPVLVIAGYKDEDGPPILAPEKKIVYRFGGFTEYNPDPDNFAIRKISFSTTGCFGSCPIFSLDISGNRQIIFNAKEHNEKQGRFTGTIDANTFGKLVSTINYIDILHLKKEYAVPWTDDQGSTLTVTLSNGRTVKISDYGMVGTFGLENLYGQLFELRGTVKWNK